MRQTLELNIGFGSLQLVREEEDDPNESASERAKYGVKRQTRIVWPKEGNALEDEGIGTVVFTNTLS